jgi:hypothetical protein
MNFFDHHAENAVDSWYRPIYTAAITSVLKRDREAFQGNRNDIFEAARISMPPSFFTFRNLQPE